MIDAARPRLDYEPRVQLKPFHARTQRYAIIVSHRRYGKTLARCVDSILRASQHVWPTGVNFAFIAPTQKQAKLIAWPYLNDFARPFISGDKAINETELRLELMSGARIHCFGAENADNLRGVGLSGVVLDEFADMSPSVWIEVIRPALSDRQGFCVFIGTPKGRNEFHRLYEEAVSSPDRWFSLLLRASESGILPERELADLRHMYRETPEAYRQEYECDFLATVSGAYFGKQLRDAEAENRIASVPPAPGEPVHTAWDIGVGDATAIWAYQVVEGAICVIGYYEATGFGAGHYVGVCKTKGWDTGTCWLPHDIKVREWGSGKTRVEQMVALGAKTALVPWHYKEDGINGTRMTLPLCSFDAVACRDGLEHLRQYRPDFDERRGVFSDSPRHDQHCHGADAMIYLCMAYRACVPKPPSPKPSPFKPPRETSIGDFAALGKGDFISEGACAGARSVQGPSGGSGHDARPSK